MAAAAAATQRGLRLSPAFLATPLHSGNAVLLVLFSSIGALGKNYHSRRPMRRGPDTARSAGGEAKLGRRPPGRSP